MFVCLLAANVVLAFSINVKDFGAVGDGVHDDTLALQKAADSVYPKGVRRGYDKILMRQRYNRASEYGVIREVFLPKGIYRITGPVMFSNDAVVRGEDGVIVRNDNPTKESFYFHRSHQMRLSGISFVGGRNQIRVFECNRAGPLYISECSFSKAAGISIYLDSLMLQDGVNYGAAPGARPDCSPYIVTRDDDGRVTLTDRPPETMRDNYNSPLIVIENCRFVDNAHAIRAGSDGLIVRNCDFKASRTAAGYVIRVGTQAHLDRLNIYVEHNPVLEQCAIETDRLLVSVTDTKIVSDGDLTAFRSCGAAYRSSICTQLQLKNITLDTGKGTVVRFADDSFPALVAIHGLTAGPRCQKGQKLFDFEVEPTPERFEKWYSRAIKGANCPIPRMHDLASYAVVIEGVDLEHFDASLPPLLERFRRPVVPGLVRPHAERFDGGGDFGAEIVASGVGRDIYSEKSADDTEALERILAEAAKLPAATVILPPRWIRTTRPIRLAGRIKVIARGVAVLTGADSDPIFTVAPDADVFCENLVFHLGRNAVATDAATGRIRLRHCFFYDQAEESIWAVSKDCPSRVRIEVTAGNAYSHAFYRGNATPMLFDGTELNNTSNYTAADYKAEKMSQSCHPYVNLAGGRLTFHDILCTPWFMEHVQPMRTAGNQPKPWQLGDYRYIDNYGELVSTNFRFGGEWGGITPVYQYGAAAKAYIEGGYVINNCPWLRAGAAVVLADTPAVDVTLTEFSTSNFREQKPAYAAWRGADSEVLEIKTIREANTFPFSHPK